MADDGFAASYREARELFLHAARARRAAVEHIVLEDLRGAQGETLAIDTALLGEPDAPAMLLVSSGTHGVEGFCGSGAQVALLRDDRFIATIAAQRLAVLMIHALNPYGFSHLRRVNENNVDLNRNFRDFAGPPPANALYAKLHPYLLPDVWPPTPANHAAIGGLVALHGMTALQAAVSGGQYAFADGLFYGGTSPSWSNLRIRALLRAYGASRKRLGWIDVHSGLGPPGEAEKIHAGDPTPAALARARAWWGPDVTSADEGSSRSAVSTGTIQTAVSEECPGVEFTAIVLEIGTVKPMDILDALRAEQWLHLHPGAAGERAAIKAQLRAAFYPATPEWKGRVAEAARVAAHAALAHLGARSG